MDELLHKLESNQDVCGSMLNVKDDYYMVIDNKEEGQKDGQMYQEKQKVATKRYKRHHVKVISSC